MRKPKTTKAAQQADAAKAPPFQKLRTFLQTNADELRPAIATHLQKVINSSATMTIALRDTMSMKRSHNAPIPGLTSATIEAETPVGLSLSAQRVGIACDLCRRIPVPGYAKKVAPIDLALRADLASLIAIGLAPDEAQALIDSSADLSDQFPATIDPSLTQVFFEAGAQAVLITPLHPVKIAHELNARRRPGRTQSASKVTAEPKQNDSLKQPLVAIAKTPVPRHTWMSVGGQNPQNVSYLVATHGENLSRGSIPLLFFKAPSADQSPNDNPIARALRTGTVFNIDRKAKTILAKYAVRSTANIDSGQHKTAERDAAMAIAEIVLDDVEAIKIFIEKQGSDIWERAAWKRIDKLERPLVDSRLKSVNADALAVHLAAKLQHATRHIDQQTSRSLSDRSMEALTGAISATISTILD